MSTLISPHACSTTKMAHAHTYTHKFIHKEMWINREVYTGCSRKKRSDFCTWKFWHIRCRIAFCTKMFCAKVTTYSVNVKYM